MRKTLMFLCVALWSAFSLYLIWISGIIAINLSTPLGICMALLGTTILLCQVFYYAAVFGKSKWVSVVNVCLFGVLVVLIIGIPIYIGEFPLPVVLFRLIVFYLLLHLCVLIGKGIPLLRTTLRMLHPAER